MDDKALHFAASAIISVYLSQKMSKEHAVIVTMGVGIVKELSDRYIDPQDLLADQIGASVILFF
jgi:hypothetical protein